MSYRLLSLLPVLMFPAGCRMRGFHAQTSEVEAPRAADARYDLKEGKVGDGFREGIPASVRIDFIKRARVWNPDFVRQEAQPALPAKYTAWDFSRPVDCLFHLPENADDAPGGLSPKFICDLVTSEGKKRDLKVKFMTSGQGEEFQFEPFSGPVGTRLLRTFGFYGDNEFPSQVTCRDCPASPENPWTVTLAAREGQVKSYQKETRTYSPASIEFKFPGYRIESRDKNPHCVVTSKLDAGVCEGWAFRELFEYLPDDRAARLEQIRHREALVILSGLIQHTDNKPGNQRLLCPYDAVDSATCRTEGETKVCGCKAPVMMVQDPGRILGSGKFSIDPRTLKGHFSAFDFDAWRNTAVWNTRKGKCVLQVGGPIFGSLFDFRLTRPGVEFFLSIYDAIPNRAARIEEIFRSSGVERIPELMREHLARGGVVVSSEGRYLTPLDRIVTARDWVVAFDEKVAELRRGLADCPADAEAYGAGERSEWMQGWLALEGDTHTYQELQRRNRNLLDQLFSRDD